MIDDRCSTPRLGRTAAGARSRPPRRRHRPAALAGGDAGRVSGSPCSPRPHSSPPCSTRATGCRADSPIGPLTEVAAQHHTWAELSPVLDRGPRAAFVAHERVLRGEVDRPTPTDLPAVLELPLDTPAVGAGVRARDVHRRRRGVPDARPARRSRLDRDRRPRRGAPRRRCRPRRPPARRTVAGQLERSSRRGLRRGRRRRRRSARSVSGTPGWPRSTRRPRWPGSRGPARAAAPTVAGEGRRRGASAHGGCWRRSAISIDEWPVPPDELGRLAAELTWYRWDAHEPAVGWSLQLADRRRGQRHRLGDHRPRRRLTRPVRHARKVVHRCQAPMQRTFARDSDRRSDQPRAWRAARSCGSTLCTSPTMPRSAMPKIGASLSLLIAMMFFEPFMPTMCWVAPEMPAAM